MLFRSVPYLQISNDGINKHGHLLVSGAKLKFEVRVADGVCFTVDNPSSAGSFEIDINSKYEMALLTDGVDAICVDDDNSKIILRADVTPIESKKNILEYICYVGNSEFARTKDDTLQVDAKTYPSIVQIGSTLSFSVKSYDDVCYTAENPASSSSVQVKINGRYNVRLISESGTQICLVDDNTEIGRAHV